MSHTPTCDAVRFGLVRFDSVRFGSVRCNSDGGVFQDGVEWKSRSMHAVRGVAVRCAQSIAYSSGAYIITLLINVRNIRIIILLTSCLYIYGHSGSDHSFH